MLATPKQVVVSNPIKAFRNATRISPLLDDQLCISKYLTHKELDGGVDILLDPPGGGSSVQGKFPMAPIDLEIPDTHPATGQGGSASTHAHEVKLAVSTLPITRWLAALLMLCSFSTQATVSGPEIAQLLNDRYQNTASTCAASEPAWYCNGVLVQPRVYTPGETFWQHDTDATALGAEGFAYLRRDLGIRQLSHGNGTILSDRFTAVGDGKTLEVLCAYPFNQTLNANRGGNGCALPVTAPAIADQSSCAALGVTDSPGWLTHFQQAANDVTRQCSLSSLESNQFAASLSAHEALGSAWSTRPNLLQVSNWDATTPHSMPVQALFYDIHQAGAMRAAQKDQRDYFNATGDWLPVLRMDLEDSAGRVFEFNLEDQLYVGYSVAARMNQRWNDARPQCAEEQAGYYCNGVLFRSNLATTDFHAWDPSPNSIRNNGVSFSYVRKDIIIDRLVFARAYGFTFREAAAPAPYPAELRCAYPYDGSTVPFLDACSHFGKCRELGVTSVDLWFARYADDPSYSCAFENDPAQFQLSIDVRSTFPDKLMWNEIVIATWPTGIPDQLPLESFFYQTDSTGLPQAQFIQTDYYTVTQRFLPLVQMDLSAPGGQMFSFNPAEQLDPGAPASTSSMRRASRPVAAKPVISDSRHNWHMGAQ